MGSFLSCVKKPKEEKDLLLPKDNNTRVSYTVVEPVLKPGEKKKRKEEYNSNFVIKDNNTHVSYTVVAPVKKKKRKEEYKEYNSNFVIEDTNTKVVDINKNNLKISIKFPLKNVEVQDGDVIKEDKTEVKSKHKVIDSKLVKKKSPPSVRKVINPLTGRLITVNGALYNKLIEEGKISSDFNNEDKEKITENSTSFPDVQKINNKKKYVQGRINDKIHSDFNNEDKEKITENKTALPDGMKVNNKRKSVHRRTSSEMPSDVKNSNNKNMEDPVIGMIKGLRKPINSKEKSLVVPIPVPVTSVDVEKVEEHIILSSKSIDLILTKPTKHAYKLTDPLREQIPCKQCHKEFTRYKKDTWREFCSKECVDIHKLNSVTASSCKECGEKFIKSKDKTWREFCSKECSEKNKLKNKSLCKTCNGEFIKTDSWREFCSKSCSEKNKLNKEKDDTNEAICKRCNKKFLRNKDQNWRQCCSKECIDLLLIDKECVTCHTSFKVFHSESYKKYCGKPTCYGENNYNRSQADKHYFTKSVAHSNIACIWLESIIQTEHINIQHAKNGGEVQIPYFGSFISFDGYCKETNTVYEFHGDYWHGNPEKYNQDDINPDTNCTFGELYQKTLDREQYIRDEGFHLITIWESEYHNISK